MVGARAVTVFPKAVSVKYSQTRVLLAKKTFFVNKAKQLR